MFPPRAASPLGRVTEGNAHTSHLINALSCGSNAGEFITGAALCTAPRRLGTGFLLSTQSRREAL